MSKNTIKIKDVAKVAGVSTATVSRTLNKPETVTEKTKEAVLNAIKTTGYHINQTARNLRKQRVGIVAALLPDLSNPFFSKILSAMATVLAENDLSLIVVDSQQIAFDPDKLIEFLYMKQADGIIVLDSRISISHLAPNDCNPPVIYACEWATKNIARYIRVDNQSGGALAIKHLIDLGHKNIGLLCGPFENPLTKSRAGGAYKAILESNAKIHDDWFISGDFTLDAGTKAAQKWASLKNKPTAMFCMSDQMAFGFIAELARLGYSVPEHVSVVGFDDIEIAKYFNPALTTIHQPREKLGYEAAKMLVSMLQKNNKNPDTKNVILPVELVVRDTTTEFKKL